MSSTTIHTQPVATRPTHPQVGSGKQLLRLFLVELRLFLREPQVLIFVLGFPALTVLVLSGVFGTETDDSGFEFVNPSHFYVAAYFGVVLASIGLIMLPARVASYREHGVLRRYDTAGFARWIFPAVQFLCGITFALMGFASLLLTAQFAADGIPSLHDPATTIVGLVAGTLAFISIGVALGMLYPTSRAASGLGLALFFPMFLMAGGGPPPEALTDGMRSVANFMPLTHVIRAVQEPWLNLGDGRDHLVIVLAIFAVSTAIWLWRSTQVSRAS